MASLEQRRILHPVKVRLVRKDTGGELEGKGHYAGEAVATSQPAIGKKRLAGAVLMTKAVTRASCRDQPSAPGTSHTAIGEIALAQNSEANCQKLSLV